MRSEIASEMQNINKSRTPLKPLYKGIWEGLLLKDIEMAGEQGVEPRLSDPETDVLPLDDSPARLELSYIGYDLSSILKLEREEHG